MTDQPEKEFFVCPNSEGCQKKNQQFTPCFHRHPHEHCFLYRPIKSCPDTCVSVPYAIVKNERELP